MAEDAASISLLSLAKLPTGFIDAASVTDFADQAVLLPLAIGMGLLLVLSGWHRGAFAWAAAIGGTLAIVVLLKLRFFACGHFLPGATFSNPSGHTAAAAAIYGGLAAMLVRAVWNDRRSAVLCAAAIGIAVAIVIGKSRLMLDLHSRAEVVAGGVIGAIGAVSFAMLAGAPSRTVRITRVLATGALVMMLLYGFHISAEAAIRSVARSLVTVPLPICG